MVKKNDNWFVSLVKQRRIWSVFLSMVAVAGLVLGYPVIPELCCTVAGSLGLHSFIYPKK